MAEFEAEFAQDELEDTSLGDLEPELDLPSGLSFEYRDAVITLFSSEYSACAKSVTTRQRARRARGLGRKLNVTHL